MVTTSDYRPMSVRLPSALEARIRERAVAGRRSLSAEIVLLLEGALEERDGARPDAGTPVSPVSADGAAASVETERALSAGGVDVSRSSSAQSKAELRQERAREFRGPDPKGAKKR